MRQQDQKGRALADLAVDEDEAAGLLDDAVDRRKTEAGAGADLLGGEEGIEDPVQVLARHAAAGVRSPRSGIVARRQGLALALGDTRESASRCRCLIVSVPPWSMASRALTARLMMTCSSWPWSALTRAQVAAVGHLELDVLADQAAQQMRQLGQDVGQVEHLGLQGLLAREGQQLAHQVGRAVGVLLDLHDVGEGLIARPVAQQQQIGKSDHRRQQVVEIVRDAAGQLADRLHLLRLDELQLEALLLGGVDEVRDETAQLLDTVLLPARD